MPLSTKRYFCGGCGAVVDGAGRYCREACVGRARANVVEASDTWPSLEPGPHPWTRVLTDAYARRRVAKLKQLSVANHNHVEVHRSWENEGIRSAVEEDIAAAVREMTAIPRRAGYSAAEVAVARAAADPGGTREALRRREEEAGLALFAASTGEAFSGMPEFLDRYSVRGKGTREVTVDDELSHAGRAVLARNERMRAPAR